MGLIDDAIGTVTRRTKDTLTYKAGDAVSDAALKGVGTIVGKAKGEKGATGPLDKCPKCKAKLEPDAKFCPECGTHMVTRPVGLPAVVLKVGTLDDPALFGSPQMAIYTIDKQAFHQIPEGIPTFERLPRRG